MEMLVIGVVALAAFAAVLIPLFRRNPRGTDESEFEVTPPTTPGQSAAGAPETGPRAGGSAPVSAGMTSGAASASGAPDDGSVGPGADDPLESEVQRYRVAVRSGTVCRKCGQANPAASVYCFDCGERLPLGDAKEFE